MVADYKKNIIEIPRMDLVQGEVTAVFHDFDLNTSDFHYQALEQEIIRMDLKDSQNVETIKSISSGSWSHPVKLIISELIDYPEIDYDDNADLLYHLSTQAYEALKENIPENKKLNQTIYQFKSAIASRIYSQMKQHFELSTPEDVVPKVFPFTNIEPWNFSAFLQNGYKDYRDIVSPVKSIPKYVYTGFNKACHLAYKFDSKAEQDLAFVLENDHRIEKWLRPAPSQFRIYWDHNSRQYVPDFIAETDSTIFMIEVKRSDQLEDSAVLAKMEAAKRYCQYATEYNMENDSKSWQYLLIPHNEIERNSGFQYLSSNYAEK